MKKVIQLLLAMVLAVGFGAANAEVGCQNANVIGPK